MQLSRKLLQRKILTIADLFHTPNSLLHFFICIIHLSKHSKAFTQIHILPKKEKKKKEGK